MKHILLFIAITLFSLGIQAQEKFLNGGFENWDDVNNPTSFSHIESVTQETTIVHSGTYSARHDGGTSDLGQVVAVTEGKTYTISLWYYVESGDGSDARIWSYWRDSESANISDDASDLRGPNNSYFTSAAEWNKYEVTLVAPAGATELYFEVRTYSGAVAYYDDFSVYESETVAGELTLTSPNGGEEYNAGETVSITWEASNVTNINIEVFNDESQWDVIATNIAAVDGVLSFTIPINAWSWDGYKLKIVDANLESVYDESDNAFTINGHDVELFYQEFGGVDFGSFATSDILGDQSWDASLGEYAKMNGYVSGEGALDNEDWLVSPQVNLNNSISEVFEFNAYYNYDGPDLKLYYTDNYTGDASTTSWTELPFTIPSDKSTWELIRVDISDLSGVVYFGFKYVSNPTDGAADWRVNNIYVSGIGSSANGIDKVSSELKIYPNPFTSQISINSTNIITKVEIINTIGQVVKLVNADSENVVVPTSDLKTSIYLVNITDVDGNVSTKKLMKK